MDRLWSTVSKEKEIVSLNSRVAKKRRAQIRLRYLDCSASKIPGE